MKTRRFHDQGEATTISGQEVADNGSSGPVGPGAWPGLVLDHLAGREREDRRLVRAFWRETGAPATRRSHFVAGRFENIYPALERLPEADTLLAAVRRRSAACLGHSDPDRLGLNVWFNVMAPGDATLPHRHDVAHERLSGVYYLAVPAASGELRVTTPRGQRGIAPRQGLLVLFPPSWEHEVTTHLGQGIRLSMAFNIGLRQR